MVELLSAEFLKLITEVESFSFQGMLYVREFPYFLVYNTPIILPSSLHTGIHRASVFGGSDGAVLE